MPAPRLSAERPAEHAKAAEPELAGANDSKGVLLIVDDDALNRDLLTRRVQREGYTAVAAEDGWKALELLKSRRFDLLLLDMLMPGLDGFGVLSAVRANAETRSLPVIVISAMDEIDSVVRSVELGADDYLTKPFNTVLLRARIGALLERKRLYDRERSMREELQKSTAELQRQTQVARDLLLNILPRQVAEELQARGSVQPMYFEDATIMFTDFVGFTRSVENLAADELVSILNEYFTAFDRITTRYGLEKLKTIGDSYMAVGGLPERKASHAVDAVLAALEMTQTVRDMARRSGSIGWEMRVGVHTGPVVAGVVGIRKFVFDIWGESVNLSSRMESSGAPNRINVSAATHTRIKDFFRCEKRGRCRTKDGNELEMFFVDGIASSLEGGGGDMPPKFRDRYRSYFSRDLAAFPAGLNARPA